MHSVNRSCSAALIVSSLRATCKHQSSASARQNSLLPTPQAKILSLRRPIHSPLSQHSERSNQHRSVLCRVWLFGVRVLVLLVVWLTHVYVRREFESRNRHKFVFAVWVALLWVLLCATAALNRCRKEEHFHWMFHSPLSQHSRVDIRQVPQAGTRRLGGGQNLAEPGEALEKSISEDVSVEKRSNPR